MSHDTNTPVPATRSCLIRGSDRRALPWYGSLMREGPHGLLSWRVRSFSAECGGLKEDQNDTLLETNIALENRPLESRIPTIHF